MKTNKLALKIFGAFLLMGIAFLLPVSNTFAQSERASAQVPEIKAADAIDPIEGHTIVSNTGEKFTAEDVFDTKGIELKGKEKFVQSGFEGSNIIDLVQKLPKEDWSETPLGEGYDGRSVIGADERWRVYNTTTYPNRSIAKMIMRFPNGQWSGCTGWVIGADTIATAGHCIYNSGAGGWADRVYVYPGRNGSSSPYGYAYATALYSVSGWTSSASQNYDYGAVKLNRNIGTTVGAFGFGWQSSNTFSGGYYVTGYPGDKPANTMWSGYKKPAIKRVESMRLFYDIDTYGGQSGSPVYRTNGAKTAIAIHTNGVGGDPNREYNSGTRITRSVFNNLIAWRDL